MTRVPGESIRLATLPNLRDLGRWQAADGRTVRRGVLFRSTDLNKLAGADHDAVAELGIRTIYDFRSAAERTTEPDVDLDGIENIALDVLADSPQAIPGNLTTVLADPVLLAGAQQRYGGSVEQLMLGSYDQLITLPSALTSYREFYRGLLGEHPAPSLFHCTTGKDRTGWAAASFLTLMGVAEDDVFEDYLLTNEQLVPALEPVFAAFEAAGGDRAELLPVLGVQRSYLERALAVMHEEYGSIDRYFADGLGIDAQRQDALREQFLVDG
jgi:protein-tyrosine phosphatase